MPYEDDYKAWLEKALIETNPDWVCDGMCDTEFTHDWCSKYCGKDDAYITPKCLHMYYHHIATADRKTEPSNSEKPNNCEDEPQYEMGMGTLKCDNCSEYGSFKCTKCDGEMYFKRLEPNSEPQTEINALYDQIVEDIDTRVKCAVAKKVEDEPQTDDIGVPWTDCQTALDEPQTDCAWRRDDG